MTLKISGSNGIFCGKCVELDIYGSGRSRDEALKNLIESVKMYVSSAPKEELKQKTKELKINNLSDQKIVDMVCNSTVNLV